jgi:hypothetical protein
MNREALSLLSIFDTTKEQRRTFVAQVVDNVYERHTSGLQVHYQVKCLEDIIKNITDDKRYKQAVLDDALNHGSKPFDFKHSEVAVREAGTKYDYDSCGDPKYRELKQLFDKAKKDLDERQEYLKTIPAEGITIVDEDTGEICKVHKPIKTSTTSVTIKLK